MNPKNIIKYFNCQFPQFPQHSTATKVAWYISHTQFPNRMLFVHGPEGSGKKTMVSKIAAGEWGQGAFKSNGFKRPSPIIPSESNHSSINGEGNINSTDSLGWDWGLNGSWSTSIFTPAYPKYALEHIHPNSPLPILSNSSWDIDIQGLENPGSPLAPEPIFSGLPIWIECTSEYSFGYWISESFFKTIYHSIFTIPNLNNILTFDILCKTFFDETTFSTSFALKLLLNALNRPNPQNSLDIFIQEQISILQDDYSHFSTVVKNLISNSDILQLLEQNQNHFPPNKHSSPLVNIVNLLHHISACHDFFKTFNTRPKFKDIQQFNQLSPHYSQTLNFLFSLFSTISKNSNIRPYIILNGFENIPKLSSLPLDHHNPSGSILPDPKASRSVAREFHDSLLQLLFVADPQTWEEGIFKLEKNQIDNIQQFKDSPAPGTPISISDFHSTETDLPRNTQLRKNARNKLLSSLKPKTQLIPIIAITSDSSYMDFLPEDTKSFDQFQFVNLNDMDPQIFSHMFISPEYNDESNLSSFRLYTTNLKTIGMKYAPTFFSKLFPSVKSGGHPEIKTHFTRRIVALSSTLKRLPLHLSFFGSNSNSEDTKIDNPNYRVQNQPPVDSNSESKLQTEPLAQKENTLPWHPHQTVCPSPPISYSLPNNQTDGFISPEIASYVAETFTYRILTPKQWQDVCSTIGSLPQSLYDFFTIFLPEALGTLTADPSLLSQIPNIRGYGEYKPKSKELILMRIVRLFPPDLDVVDFTQQLESELSEESISNPTSDTHPTPLLTYINELSDSSLFSARKSAFSVDGDRNTVRYDSFRSRYHGVLRNYTRISMEQLHFALFLQLEYTYHTKVAPKINNVIQSGLAPGAVSSAGWPRIRTINTFTQNRSTYDKNLEPHLPVPDPPAWSPELSNKEKVSWYNLFLADNPSPNDYYSNNNINATTPRKDNRSFFDKLTTGFKLTLTNDPSKYTPTPDAGLSDTTFQDSIPTHTTDNFEPWHIFPLMDFVEKFAKQQNIIFDRMLLARHVTLHPVFQDFIASGLLYKHPVIDRITYSCESYGWCMQKWLAEQKLSMSPWQLFQYSLYSSPWGPSLPKFTWISKLNRDAPNLPTSDATPPRAGKISTKIQSWIDPDSSSIWKDKSLVVVDPSLIQRKQELENC